mgnify:CR=1 FL=1
MGSAQKVPLEKIREVFIAAIDRSRLSYFKYCMRAGSCAYACHFWLVEPRHELVPGIKGKRVEDVFKREFTILGKIKAKIFKEEFISQEELKKWLELAYGYCSLCDHCMLACPYSVEFPPLTLYMRVVLHAAGLTPESVKQQIKNEFEIGHPYGVTKEEWLRIVDKVRSEVDGDIPIDKKGAKILVIPGKRSLTDNLDSFISTIRILQAAKEDFTISSELWTGCMSTWDIGAWEEMRILTEKRAKIIEGLQVKTLLTTNDACGYYGWRWLADRVLRRRLKFDVLDLTELVSQYIKEGRIKLDSSVNDFRATYHDPCHLARKGGVVKEPRIAIKHAVKEFVEMPNSGIYSFCCSEGCLRVDEYRHTRLKAFKPKFEDIKATNAEYVITACDECFSTMKEFLNEYGSKVKVIDIATLVANALT